MWDILIQKAHAYMILVAAHRPSEFRYARRIINFMNQRGKIPMIIGLTHTDCAGAWFPDNIAIALGYPEENERPIIVNVNANEKNSVAQSVIVLVQQLMQKCLV